MTKPKSKPIVVFCGAFATLLGVEVSHADSTDATIEKVLNVCSAPDVRTAVDHANQLGWRRQNDEAVDEWRTAFIGYNGGSVDVVAWRSREGDKADTLSFWVAVGRNGHKACAYSTSSPEGLLDTMVQFLGPPETSEMNDTIQSRSASWTQGGLVYRFGQVGSAGSITVGPN